MTTLEEVRKSIEAVIGNLTPAKAQELAKSLSDPGTAKEQVSKLAADMLVWSQRSRPAGVAVQRRNPKTPSPMRRAPTHQYARRKFDVPMTICAGSGSARPMPSNRAENRGRT